MHRMACIRFSSAFVRGGVRRSRRSYSLATAGNGPKTAHERHRVLAFVVSDPGVFHFTYLAAKTAGTFLEPRFPFPGAVYPALGGPPGFFSRAVSVTAPSPGACAARRRFPFWRCRGPQPPGPPYSAHTLWGLTVKFATGMSPTHFAVGFLAFIRSFPVKIVCSEGVWEPGEGSV